MGVCVLCVCVCSVCVCVCEKDTLRDCAQDTGHTCYNTVVSPLYFVSFVLTAQFVLVNVVIAVLMKHLEESNKEAKEEAEMEAELEAEGAEAARSPQRSPLALGMEAGGLRGSPWRSVGGEVQERGASWDSPPADITQDSDDHVRAEPLPCPEPPLEVRGGCVCVYL